jgi:tetratricopeptide (TPR) repeat protein
VRAYSGEVLLAAGGEAALAGRTSQALAFWRRAFQQGTEFQSRLIELLAPQASASFFLKNFEPNLGGMRLLCSHYGKIGRAGDLRLLRDRLAEMLVQEAAGQAGRRSAHLWREASGVYHGLGDGAKALDCAWRAVQLAPDDFQSHRELAARLLEQERLDEAVQELRWCRRRRPDDQKLVGELEAAYRRRLETRRCSDAAAEGAPTRTRR